MLIEVWHVWNIDNHIQNIYGWQKQNIQFTSSIAVIYRYIPAKMQIHYIFTHTLQKRR